MSTFVQYAGIPRKRFSFSPPAARTASTKAWFHSFRHLYCFPPSPRLVPQPHPPSWISLKASNIRKLPLSWNLTAICVHNAVICSRILAWMVVLAAADLMSSQYLLSAPSWCMLMITFRPASSAYPTTSAIRSSHASSILYSGASPKCPIHVTGMRTVLKPAAFTFVKV